MDTLILISFFALLSFGVYRLKKHSDKTREQMLKELEEQEEN
jgi:preprotein translocase subunit YajC